MIKNFRAYTHSNLRKVKVESESSRQKKTRKRRGTGLAERKKYLSKEGREGKEDVPGETLKDHERRLARRQEEQQRRGLRNLRIKPPVFNEKKG